MPFFGIGSWNLELFIVAPLLNSLVSGFISGSSSGQRPLQRGPMAMKLKNQSTELESLSVVYTVKRVEKVAPRILLRLATRIRETPQAGVSVMVAAAATGVVEST